MHRPDWGKAGSMIFLVDDGQISAPLKDKTFVFLTPQARFVFHSLLV